MLRLLIVALAVLWVMAMIGRFSRRLGRSPLRSIRGAVPPPPPRDPPDDRLIGVFRIVVGTLLVLTFAVALFALTDLPDLAIVLVTAPVAGVVSSLVTEWFVSDEDADRP